MARPPAYTLPHLLSLLPKSGESSLVRPITWPSTSFYRITRTKLKFRPSASGSSSKSKNIASSSASSSSSSSSGEGDVPVEGLDQGTLKAAGKAWGMVFWDGKYQKPSSPLSNPDRHILKGLKRLWVEVDPSSLPDTAREELVNAAEVLRVGEQERKRVIEERRARRIGSEGV